MMARLADSRSLSRAYSALAWPIVAAVWAAGLAAALHAQTGASDDFARRQYETGLAFMRDGRYQEALKDFQAVADNHPTSAVADQALLQIATYYLEQARDTPRATAAVEQLLQTYPTGRAAPFAYVLSGRLALAGGTGATQIDAALASFERARRLFPIAEVVAAAGFFKGEALRMGGRCAEAMPAYQDVVVEYPRLQWAGRAELGLGRCLVQLDRARDAMPHLQRVRRYARDLPAIDADTALHWNTILARLYLRAPADPAFTYAGRPWGTSAPAKPQMIRDVVAMAIVRDDPSRELPPSPAIEGSAQRKQALSDELHLRALAAMPPIAILTDQSFALYSAQGAVVESFVVREPRGLVIDAAGRPLVVTDGGLLRPRASSTAGAIGPGGRELLTLRPGTGASARPLEDVAAACTLSTGEMLVADRRARAIHRFDAAGAHRGQFAALNATRLAANERDAIAAIDRDSKNIVLLDAQGAVVRRLPPRGEGYQFDEPIDIALDAIGHVYVLDRRTAAVFVFARDGKLVTRLSSPDAGEGAFSQPTSLALDASGRLFVHDERQRALVVYQ